MVHAWVRIDEDNDGIKCEVIDSPSLTYTTRSVTGRVTLSQTSMWPAPPDSFRGASTRTDSGNGSAEDSNGEEDVDEEACDGDCVAVFAVGS